MHHHLGCVRSLAGNPSVILVRLEQRGQTACPCKALVEVVNSDLVKESALVWQHKSRTFQVP